MGEKTRGALNTTEQVLVDLLANCLFDAGRKIPSDIDWQCVYREAAMQTIDSLVFIDDSGVPEDVKRNMATFVYATLRNNILVEKEHVDLHAWMQELNIPYVVLKGCASAMYYHKPIYRVMGDVDFLVAKENLGQVEQYFQKKGFEARNKNHICHEVLIKEGSHYEMHFEPAGIPKGEAGQLARDYFATLLEDAVIHETEQGDYMVPSKFHHGLILLLHTCHHLTGEGIGLRHLCDWAVFVNSMEDEEFCEMFQEKLQKLGVWYFARTLTAMAMKYLACPPKAWVGDIDPLLVVELMQDILKGGNFGNKDYNRGHEVLLISNRGKEGIGNKSMIREFFASANRIVYENWPFAKNCKILNPFGWIFYGGRYVLRSLFGKRPKINVKKVTQGAKERRELYAKLHLYEI